MTSTGAASDAAAICWVCQATPAGRGAIATVLVLGDRAAELVGLCFQSAAGKPLEDFPIHRIVFGRWRDESGTGEELVVARRARDRVEVHCHGGSAAAEAVIRALVDVGCQRTTWQELAIRVEPDRLAAEARVALAEATTRRTANHLLAQYQGALSRVLRTLREQLQSPDLGPPQLADLREQLRELNQSAPFGLHLTQPWRVVLAGQANVGKSSLINALLGYKRAIVFDQPGTTRDVLQAETAVDGWPIQLADTAGLRDTADAIEATGHELARRTAATADLLLLVFDASRTWSAQDQQLLDQWPTAQVLHNKCDLAVESSAARPEGMSISALTGEGVAPLLALIARRLVPQVPDVNAAVVFTPRQQRLVEAAELALAAGDVAGADQRLSELIGGM